MPANKKIEEFKRQTKEAGFKPRIDWADSIGFGVSAYNSERGVGITYQTLNSTSPFWAVQFHVRLRSGRDYRTVEIYSTLETAIEKAKKLRGSKNEKKMAAERFRKRIPTRAESILLNGVLTRPCNIKTAFVHGFCQLSESGTILEDVSNPNTEPYFLVECEDFRCRTLYVVLKNAENFYIAIKRGKVIKLTADDKLFTGGKHPLDLSLINREDLEFIIKAVELWTKSL